MTAFRTETTPERLLLVIWDMPGRSMKAYVVMPNEVVDDPTRLDAWLAAAFDYTATLPPKCSAGDSLPHGCPGPEPLPAPSR